MGVAKGGHAPHGINHRINGGRGALKPGGGVIDRRASRDRDPSQRRAPSSQGRPVLLLEADKSLRRCDVLPEGDGC